MNVTLRQVRAFVAVAQTGSFSAAALRLHLTQSALSTLVRALEVELDVALFVRTTRRVALTDAGREFLPQAERVLADLGSAVVGARTRAARARGQINVVTTPTAASLLLPPVLAAYRLAQPDVFVALQDEPAPQEILRQVLSGDADLGIGPIDHAQRRAVDVETVLQDEIVLACHHEHPLARHRQIDWISLARERFIGFNRDNALQALIDGAAASAGLQIQAAYQVSSISTAMALVEQGLGVAALPSYSRPLRRAGSVRYRSLVAPVVRRDLCLLKLRGRVLSPEAIEFSRMLLGRNASW
jgi:LysR family transcriptional regulator, carnitine catabolism transcriptional activator